MRVSSRCSGSLSSFKELLRKCQSGAPYSSANSLPGIWIFESISGALSLNTHVRVDT